MEMDFPVIPRIRCDLLKILQEAADFFEKGIDLFENSVIISLVPRV